MGKPNRDIPVEQREFFKHFETAAYHHSYSEVFDDYLTMMMNWWADGKLQEERNQALKKYAPKQRAEFTLMYNAHVALQNEMIVNRGMKWYDALGDIYQTITSNWKASGMGQFFTPGTVTDFISQILISDDSPGYELINEPCAGSGRMILSAHACNPLNFYWAMDLDPMCFKMTAINMCFHNMAGIVSHANTLSLEFYKSYVIERVQLADKIFVPVIRITTEDEATSHYHYLRWYCSVMKGQPYPPPPSDGERLRDLAYDKSRLTMEPKRHELFTIPPGEETLTKIWKKKSDPNQIKLFNNGTVL